MRVIKSLDDVRRVFPDGYHDICVEIVGTCNARCKYCPSGNPMSNVGRGIMMPDMLEAIIRSLLEYKIIGRQSHINLFWWGEPFLHPRLNEMIAVTQKYNVPYVLSTNAAHYQELLPQSFSNLKRLIISMPGFSQRSYDRMHQFRFDEVKTNIESYAENFSKNGGGGKQNLGQLSNVSVQFARAV